jgi:zinc D-Ala-D-Ala carboxypeptidase
MTRVPAGAADLVAPTAPGIAPFDDCFPTQPIAVGRGRAGLVPDDRHRRGATSPRMPSAYRPPPPARHHRAAATGDVPSRGPARTAAGSTRLTILVVAVVVIAAATGALGYQMWASSSQSAAPDAVARSAPAMSPDDLPRQHPPPRDDDRHGERNGAVGEADGAVPDGVTVFDDEFPAVANLDPGLLKALRQAATDAADDGVGFVVNSGWRSAEYQEQLLREAIAEYGSESEAARWVATPETSPHVSGDGVDIGPSAAAAWLSEHGAEYGLCQIYRNEPWHFELRPEAVDDGCPPLYADPTHDPRMQQ